MLKHLRIPIVGFIFTATLTILSYISLSNSINQNETLVTENIKDRIGVEFEWRYGLNHTSSVMGFLSANVTREEYFNLTIPSTVFSSSLGWFPKVYPKDREKYVEQANLLYKDIGYEYEITYSSDLGVIAPRPVDNQYMYPLLFSNPMTLTYIGYDFYGPTSVERPDSLMDLAVRLRQPVSTDKIILSFFGGPSFFVDEDLNPISGKEEPVSFIIFHSVYDNKGNDYGVIGNNFEPRGFISDIVTPYRKVVTSMNVYVFRKTNFVGGTYELLFDLNTFEEANPFTEITFESVKSTGKRNYVSILKSDVGNDISGRLELVIILTSNTKPNPILYSIVLVVGLVSTLSVWYIYTRVQKESVLNEKLAKSKSKFIVEMSHELRTPLNGIMGMTDILGCEKLSTEGADCLEDLNTCSKLLLNIISEVLDFSKIEAGKLQPNLRKEDVRKFFKKTIKIMTFYRSLIEKENDIELSLRVDENVPIFMVSDFSKIGKILMNFVGNSIKFTTSGSIKVTISCEKHLPFLDKISTKSEFLKIHEGEELRYLKIVIRDTGEGMSSESMENLFQPFAQVQLGRSSDGGTGLGLVICKTFAESMGGGIKCESEVNIGTTFTTWVQCKFFPIDSSYLYGHYDQNMIVRSSIKNKIYSVSEELPTVLVVDDVTINLRVIGKLLNSMGIPFDTCSSGEESVVKCKSYSYKVILMDYFMEGISGIEAGIQIKSGEMNNKSNIIILTANEYTEDIRKAGLGFLQKPVNRGSLSILLQPSV